MNEALDAFLIRRHDDRGGTRERRVRQACLWICTSAALRLAAGAQVAAGALVLPRAADAQTCFRGRPLPHCHAFGVTELGYSYRINGGATATGGALQVHYLNGDLGWMFNLSPRFAAGGTAFVGALVDYAFTMRVGVKGRARRWLNESTALDLSAGPVVGRTEDNREMRVGLTSHLGVSFTDRLGLLTALEVIPTGRGPDAAWYVGARLGSKPAVWSGGALGLLLGVAAVAFAD